MLEFLALDWISVSMLVAVPLSMLVAVPLSMLVAVPLSLLVAVPLSLFFIACGAFCNYRQGLRSGQSLYYKECSLNSFILARCKLEERPFTPHFCLRSRHVQTLLSYCLPVPEVTYEREYLQMRDRGVVAIDWVVSPHVKLKRKTPILLVVPALARGPLSVNAICHAAASKGMQPVVINSRGHGGSVLTTAKLMSLGDPSDLRQVVTYLKLRMPKANLAAIAFGTGCSLLLSYLGEFGSSALLSVAVCVSPCYNEPFRFASEIRSGYDLLLMLRLKALVCRHAKALATVLGVGKALSAWTFDHFLQAVYGPLYGHASAEEFWEANDSLRDVDDIAIPLLCVNSLDDPVCRAADIPYELFRCYPNFLLVLTRHGGHCGFWEGDGPSFPAPQPDPSVPSAGRPWLQAVCLDYVEAVIEFTTKPPPSASSSFSHSMKLSNSQSSVDSDSNPSPQQQQQPQQQPIHGLRRSSFNRSFSSSKGSSRNNSYSSGNNTPVNHNIEVVGGTYSGIRYTRMPLKRCRFTI